MNNKRGLGKGLQALIPFAADTGADKGAVKEIPVEDIIPGGRQARKHFDREKLKELAESIREFGVIQPIIVRTTRDGGFELIAGERRWRACKEAGLKTVPALVKELEDIDVAAVSLIENIQRENLSPLEEAATYRKLLGEYGLTQEELSARIGKSRPSVTNMIRLLELPERVKELLSRGELTPGHARAILALPGEEIQVEAAEKIVMLNLNVRQAERLVKKLLYEDKGLDEKAPPVDWLNQIMETAVQVGANLGCKAKIRGKRRGRYIFEMEFKSEEELRKAVNLLSSFKH